MSAARWVVCAALLLAPVTLATPSGNRWAMTTPCGACAMGTQCVGVQCVPLFKLATSIDNNGGTVISGGVSYANFAMILQNSFVAWTTPRVSCNTSWNSVYGGTFSTPMGLGALNGMDRNNFVIFLSGANWTHLSNELALTTTTYFTSNHEIFDGDMEFNNNITWSETAAANTYDLFSVTVHEAGHFLGLNHTTSSSVPVMYPTVSLGTAKRSLTSIDEGDVCAVYPGAAGGQGTSCTMQSDCTSPRVCEAISGGTNKICTADCASASDTCPAGYTCQASTNGMACLPQIGVPDQCKFCQSGAGCSSGLCLRFDTGVTFCSLNCTENAQCGPNYTCQMPEGFCVPNANTCTNQCTTTANCATGYDCTGGTCVPRGNTGDPCTVSLVCKPCNVCTRESATSDTAFCRACCAGMGGGGLCNACTNATCDASSTCANLTGSTSGVCIPGSAAPTSCQACNNGQCAQGLSCVYGRCREACNPAAPGSCQACFPNGAGGACACGDEMATAGEPCGLIGQTLAACGPGLACVGNANPICRSQCDVSTPNSCPTGQSCQMISGVGVCMPGTAGSVCAPCTNTNTCNGGLTCFLGRCYEACNVNLAQTCGTCVQSAPSGVGICGCPDQVSQVNEPCGVMPDVHSCQTGLRCLSGYCRGRCDPQIGGCPDPTVCIDQGGGNFFCAEGATGGGGGSTTGGGGGARGGGSATGGGAAGGGTGGGTTDLGCGCGVGSEPLSLVAIALAAMWRRRRS